MESTHSKNMIHEPIYLQIVPFLQALRNKIKKEFENLESEHSFELHPWQHKEGGGGEISILRGSDFEKAAVNWSGVYGKSFPLPDHQGPFYATGVSVITHMRNPHAPTVHMNVRYIQTERGHWFGGGYDLTPMGTVYEEDVKHFHTVAKRSVGEDRYKQFSANAKEYFYIAHRKKERGVGGIFFDHWNSGNFEEDFAMWSSVGESFIEAIIPIYQKRIKQKYQEQDREIQLQLRAHYAEFNLLYDRGTKFGFSSGGNPDAILCSMPPLVRW